MIKALFVYVIISYLSSHFIGTKGLDTCLLNVPKGIPPSVGFIFDYADGTAAAQYKTEIFQRLNEDIFIKKTEADDKAYSLNFNAATCNAILAATISQPAQGVIEDQTRPANDPSQHGTYSSCPFNIKYSNGDPSIDAFQRCWQNQLQPQIAGSDFISSLSRMYYPPQYFHSPYFLFNDNDTTASNRQCYKKQQNNFVFIFWSSPLGEQIGDIENWLNTIWTYGQIHLGIIPFVDNDNNELISAKEDEFDNIKNADGAYNFMSVFENKEENTPYILANVTKWITDTIFDSVKNDKIKCP